jgi:hypothetical protein
MPAIMPSQVVAAIDRLFPHAAKDHPDGNLSAGESTKLRALIDLVNDIPEELIVLSPQDYADFVHAKGTISETLLMWLHRGTIGFMAPVSGKDAVTVLRRALALLRDEYPPAAHAELAFIGDPETREDKVADFVIDRN